MNELSPFTLFSNIRAERHSIKLAGSKFRSIIGNISLVPYMEFSAARGQEANTVAGFLKGLEDHFASINNFLSLASKDNENGNLVTCIRVQTSCFSFELRRNCFPPGASQLALVAKCLPASAGDTRDAAPISGSGGPPGGGHGSLLQSSCLENPMDRGAWRATVHRVSKSRTRLSDLAYTYTPFSVGFSRRDYWSGLPFPFPRDLPDSRMYSGLLHCRQILYRLSYEGSPFHILDTMQLNEWVMFLCIFL